MKVVLTCAGTLRKNMAGVEQCVYYLAKFLQQKKIEVEVFCVTENPVGKTEYDGIPITEFPGIILNKSFYFSLELYRALQEGNHDVIHAYGINSLTTLTALAAKKKNQTMIITGASSISSSAFRKKLHPAMYFFYRMLSKKINTLVCVSDYEWDLFHQNISLPEKKYVLIPNGIDVARFASVKKTVEKFSILTVARLVRQKGVHRLVRALPKVREKYPQAVLHVVGEGSDRTFLEAEARRLEVEHAVVFHGYIQFEKLDQLIDQYARAHVFSLMADSESHGIVYAMA
ncbi:MAG: glycosyltransferase family 4 protein, partial [archaeon]